jgi:hypothetical protein
MTTALRLLFEPGPLEDGATVAIAVAAAASAAAVSVATHDVARSCGERVLCGRHLFFIILRS